MWAQSLKNKTIIVTGASSGIGKACAVKLAQAGANLILVARRVDRLAALAAELKKDYNIECDYLACDITDIAQLKTIEQALAKYTIDVLINNAGLALGLDKLQDGNPDDWSTVIDTNIKGVLYFIKLVLPKMLTRNQGHIINVGSIAGHHTYEGGAVYCATKHAVNAISHGLRFDLFETDLRVSEIAPGLVETEFSQVRFKGDMDRANKVYADKAPLQPEDIAEIINFCITAPAHVNISDVIVWPTTQAGVGKQAIKK
jgi:3-hydroxy acid dehydrogenase/malonic semialdehyde reductase